MTTIGTTYDHNGFATIQVKIDKQGLSYKNYFLKGFVYLPTSDRQGIQELVFNQIAAGNSLEFNNIDTQRKDLEFQIIATDADNNILGGLCGSIDYLISISTDKIHLQWSQPSQIKS